MKLRAGDLGLAFEFRLGDLAQVIEAYPGLGEHRRHHAAAVFRQQRLEQVQRGIGGMVVSQRELPFPISRLENNPPNIPFLFPVFILYPFC